MGWGSFRKKVIDNALPILAAPFTAGTSLAFLKDGDGNNLIDYATGAKSAREANAQNIALQNETNNKSIELANTAHQREVLDLMKAGLNPVLSAGGQGATTPTLGTAQVQNTMPGGYLAQAQTAGQVASLFSSAKQMNAQAKLSNEQAGAVNSQIRLNKAQAQIAEDQDEFYQDTGYFPGATDSQSTNMGGFGFNGGHSTTTTIRNPKKGNSGRDTYNIDNENNNKKTKSIEEKRIERLKEMGWKKSMTTHR